MRVIQFPKNPKVYSCRSYLLLGDWNQIDAINTLIDPGTDDFILQEIDKIYTGCGKVPVEQVLLTHNHFDHAASAELFRQKYGAKIYAFVPGPMVDHLLKDGQVLKAGDYYLDVLHTPGHSSDSVAFYCQSQKRLFSGDTQLRIMTAGGKYTKEYLKTLVKLSQLDIQQIYSGHDENFDEDIRNMLLSTLQNVRNSEII